VDAILGALTLPDIGELFPGMIMILVTWCVIDVTYLIYTDNCEGSHARI